MMKTGILLAAMYPGWVRRDMGGPRAPAAVKDSAAATLETISSFTEKNHGTIFKQVIFDMLLMQNSVQKMRFSY